MKSSVRWTHIALHADFTNGSWRLLILKGTCLLSWAQFHWQFPWGAVFAVREPHVWKSRASETRAVELYAESVQNSSATWEWFSKGWKYSWRTVYSGRTDEVLWKKPRINRLEYVRFPLSTEFFFHGNHNTWTLMRASDTAANRMSVRPFAPDNRTPNISFVVD